MIQALSFSQIYLEINVNFSVRKFNVVVNYKDRK